MAFTRFAVFVHLMGYELQPFHKSICDTLDDFFDRKIKKLMIFVPPQHGKSTISSILFPLYALAKDPDQNIMIGSFSGPLARGFLRKIRGIAASKEFKDISSVRFGRKEGKQVSANKIEPFSAFHRGSIGAEGLRGVWTGNTVDIGIIDDPFKNRQEAESQTMRENVWEFYTDAFSTRLNNDSIQLMLFTRWHEDDLAGRILADPDLAKDWTVLKFPALKTFEKNDYDLRNEGEALWEDKHSREKHLESKRLDLRTFEALYQQNPTPLEGNILKKDSFEIVDNIPLGVKAVHFFVDGAYTDNKKNDPSAILAAFEYQNDLYVLNVEEKHINSSELPEYIRIFAYANMYNHRSKIYVEPKASGKTIVQIVKRDTKLNITEFKFPKNTRLTVNSNKMEKVQGIASYVATGRVKLIRGHWNERFITQCISFPNAAHDDMLDTLVFAVFELLHREKFTGITLR